MDTNRILLIDKPFRWTSFEVIKALRKSLNIAKIGHAGTLDPLATGLLIVCTGKKTKTIAEFQYMDKEYEGIIALGKSTPSFDLETPFDRVCAYSHVTPEAIHSIARSFVGTISQIPPLFSAIKTKGKRAYTYARQGKKVLLAPREVRVHSFTISTITLPCINFIIRCGKGVYIRSIAHELGEKLGVGAHLASLRRTKIGEYHVQDACTMEELYMQRGTGTDS